MELDDLKGSWKKDGEKFNSKKIDIMQMIQQADNSPVATLKKNFRKRYILSYVVAFSLTVENIVMYHNDVLLWVVVAFAFLNAWYCFRQYNMLDDMQNPYQPVSVNVKEQIEVLKKGLFLYSTFINLRVPVLVVLLEVLMFRHSEPFFEGWYRQPVYTRAICYVIGFIVIINRNRYAIERNFVRHVKYLKQLLEQL